MLNKKPFSPPLGLASRDNTARQSSLRLPTAQGQPRVASRPAAALPHAHTGRSIQPSTQPGGQNIKVLQQLKKQPVAPPVYKPVAAQPVQPKACAGAATKCMGQTKATPAAPPVYRPQPTPRVLQTKQALHRGPAPVAATKPAAQSIAPTPYRPNPAPHVLQPRTASQPGKPVQPNQALQRQQPIQRSAMSQPPHSIRGGIPASGQRPPAQMKPQPVASPPRVASTAGVVQREIVIKEFGKKKKRKSFIFKRSTTDDLVEALKDKGLAQGWINEVRDMAYNKDYIYTYKNIDALVKKLAKKFPLADENKKRKREEKNTLNKRHRTNLSNVKTEDSKKGEKLRRGSFVGTTKLTTSLSKTEALKQNMQYLLDNFTPTDSGGKSLVLNTGNIFQSQLALSLVKLDDDVKGARLEGTYYRVNDGTGESESIRTVPFVKIPKRLACTRSYSEGAYKVGEKASKELYTFENVRLPENTVPSEFRYMMVKKGKLKDTQEFNPIGPYALSEIPSATTGETKSNRLMNQNAFLIFNQTKQIDNKTIIGRNADKLPKGTKVSTLESYINAYNQVTTKHTKETQNKFHIENFRISRAMFAPFYDEEGEEFVPITPPTSPRNQDYDYDDD